MAMRKVGVFGAAGVLVAVLIIAGVMMSGLKLPGFYNKGTLVIKLTDAPVDLSNLYVNITSLEVHKAEHGAEEGEWIPLEFVPAGTKWVYVDILSLQNVSRDLSVTDVLPGDYTKIRMDVSAAKANYTDGHMEDVIVPPGHLDIIVHFEIEVGFETVLLVDMTAHISQTNRLSPVLKATVVSGPP